MIDKDRDTSFFYFYILYFRHIFIKQKPFILMVHITLYCIGDWSRDWLFLADES